MIESNKILVEKVASKDNLVEVFTKSLPGSQLVLLELDQFF